MKKYQTSILLIGTLLFATGCQGNQESKGEKTSNKVTVSNSSSESNRKSSLKVKDMSANEFEKNEKKLDKVFVFFGDPHSDGYEKALKEFSEACNDVSARVYKVDTSTADGKSLLKKMNILQTPYDAVVMSKGTPVYLQIKDKGIPPKRVLKLMAEGKGTIMGGQ